MGVNYFGYKSEDWEKAKVEAEEYLIESAKKKCTISYGDLALKIKTIHIEAYGEAMSNFLDEISRKTFDAYGFMLSSLVITKSTGKPGQGFWTLAQVLNGEQKIWGYWYRKEIEKIFKYYEST